MRRGARYGPSAAAIERCPWACRARFMCLGPSPSGGRAANALVKEDAATLRAASLAREGKAANSLIDALRGADPYSTYALQVALMDGLQKGDAQRLRALSAELRAKADLFDEGDDWPRQARGILAAFGIP